MISERTDKRIMNIRHSLAHIMAAAVLKIDPKAKLGIGPATGEGFYYDFMLSINIDESILPKLEELMKEIINKKISFKKQKLSFNEARKIFSNQPFKLELIDDLRKFGTTDFHEIQLIKNKEKRPKKVSQVTIYKTGDFIDLCRGGHVKTTSEINPNCFKLVRIAGAYWRGDEKNPMLTRIYGVAFETEDELKEYMKRIEESERYNHRVLGEKLKIFMICEEVGKGLPLLLPNGEKIKNILMNYIREKEEKRGYKYVATPHLASSRLYQKSGHLDYYRENMFKVLDPEGEEYFVKPMNCPHHHMIYQKLVKSYRDLPLRLSEAGAVYRYEKSGELIGLMRVRGPITQNDAHIYVTQELLEEEFLNVVDLFLEIFNEIEIFNEKYWFRLSLPDFKGKNKDKYGGDFKLWRWASNTIKRACNKRKINLVEGVGEAAFYGPKLDIQTRNIYGKEETLATIQIDILIPRRINLVYTDKNGKEKNPIVIHRAIIGSYERFIAFLLETSKGNLPLWLSPIQFVVLPINKENLEYASMIFNTLSENGFRGEIRSEDSLSKRILLAEEEKIPLMLIIGEKEKKNRTISLRTRGEKNIGEVYLEKVLDILKMGKIINP